MGATTSGRQADTARTKTDDITEKIICGKRYVVRSVFIGDKDIKTTLLKLAEQKAIREMRLDPATTVT
jgi:hypothetical protein